jgi:hypothetical protein
MKKVLSIGLPLLLVVACCFGSRWENPVEVSMIADPEAAALFGGQPPEQEVAWSPESKCLDWPELCAGTDASDCTLVGQCLAAQKVVSYAENSDDFCTSEQPNWECRHPIQQDPDAVACKRTFTCAFVFGVCLNWSSTSVVGICESRAAP